MMGSGMAFVRLQRPDEAVADRRELVSQQASKPAIHVWAVEPIQTFLACMYWLRCGTSGSAAAALQQPGWSPLQIHTIR